MIFEQKYAYFSLKRTHHLLNYLSLLIIILVNQTRLIFTRFPLNDRRVNHQQTCLFERQI